MTKCKMCDNELSGQQKKFCSKQCKNRNYYVNADKYERQSARATDIKQELVDSRGGGCEVCGYNKCLNALEFHHLNPEEKEFGLTKRELANHRRSLVNKEFDKCIVLCANCHREHHAGILNL